MAVEPAEYGPKPSGWDAIGFESFARFLQELGTRGERNSLIERDGLIATVAPGSPERSLFNSVLYESADALEEHYDELEDAYERAGVRAWVAWAPETDQGGIRFLESKGHDLDGKPRMMTIDLADVPAVGGEGDGVTSDALWEAVCEINDVAYGYESPTFLAGMGQSCAAGFNRYAIEWQGFAASALATLEHGGDCGVYMVATLPEARRRGLAAQVMLRALRDARERGCVTSSLQASSAGAGLYRRLGYRDLGALEYRERRKRG